MWREDDREGEGGGGIGEDDDDDAEAEETSPVREQSAHHQSFFLPSFRLKKCI